MGDFVIADSVVVVVVVCPSPKTSSCTAQTPCPIFMTLTPEDLCSCHYIWYEIQVRRSKVKGHILCLVKLLALIPQEYCAKSLLPSFPLFFPRNTEQSLS